MKEDTLEKQKKQKNVKKTKKVKKDSLFSQVRQELKKVKWPQFKDVVKYSVATIVFCLILAGFFSILNLILSFIKGAFI